MNIFSTILFFSLRHFFKPRTGIGRANVAFVVDATNAEMIMFLQRFIYNIARLFQSQGTYISIIAYGRKPHLVTKWQTFTSAQGLQVSAIFSCGNPRKNEQDLHFKVYDLLG